MRSVRRLVQTGALTSIAFLTLFAMVAYQMAVNDYLRAKQTAGNVVAPAAMDIARTIESYDMSLGAIVDGYGNTEILMLPDHLRHLVLFDRGAVERKLGPIFVLNASGSVVLEARPGSVGEASHWGRDYFLIHQQNRNAGLYVSRPWMSVSGGYAIAISRRIEDSSGAFIGVAVGAIHLSYFQHVLGNLTLGTNGTLAMAHTDGTLIMRMPFLPEVVGRDVSKSEIFRQLLDANFSGAFDAVAALDGESRLYAFQRIGNLPLVLTHGVSMRAVYEDWWQQAPILGLIVLMLCAINIALLAFLTRALRQRMAAEAALADLATTDPLTGLGNRRKFDEELDREWNRALRTKTSVALLVIDADRFKKFNDSHGHQAGDMALKHLAACIARSAGRTSDTNARYGGEEFVSLLPGQDVQGAVHVATRIREEVRLLRLRQKAGFIEGPVIPTVSIGVAAMVPFTDERDQLMALADEALYLAKKNGRDRVESITPSPKALPGAA